LIVEEKQNNANRIINEKYSVKKRPVLIRKKKAINHAKNPPPFRRGEDLAMYVREISR
jgi:hypothetical protein